MNFDDVNPYDEQEIVDRSNFRTDTVETGNSNRDWNQGSDSFGELGLEK